MSQTKIPLEQMTALKTQLDKLRPVHSKALENLATWYNVELTWSSNAIEGNTLTHRETAILIEKGITVAGKPLADHIAITDHYNAIRLMRDLAQKTTPLTEDVVQNLHQAAMARSEHGSPGQYADVPRRITGSPVILPGPHKIPALMKDFGQWLETAKDPIDAFEAHYKLVSIHPFIDGNGRTARLLMNLILLRAGYPPVSIGPEQRSNYLAVLENRQLKEPLGHQIIDEAARDAYQYFMIERATTSLKDHINFITEKQQQNVPLKPSGKGGIGD
jgi:Fic family protein